MGTVTNGKVNSGETSMNVSQERWDKIFGDKEKPKVRPDIGKLIEESREEGYENEQKALWNASCPIMDIKPYSNTKFLNLTMGVEKALLWGGRGSYEEIK